MADKIEITSDCDGLGNPHPDGEKLCGVKAGSVLLLLQDYDRDYYKVAFSGRPVFVPKSCGVRVESEETREYTISGWTKPERAEGPASVREEPKRQELGPTTVREFEVTTSIWPIVDAWAEKSHCHLAESWESTRLYQSHGGFIGKYVGLDWKLEISQTGSKVRMETWVPRMWLQMLAIGSAVPPEMGIESLENDSRSVVGNVLSPSPQQGSRQKARREVNKLLERLGQPPIE
ncbi:MAG: hypothetical protein IH958_01115 [Chloroflexi bacterium]|nr:hypothetical protein [Chloroflexota bacterium]